MTENPSPEPKRILLAEDNTVNSRIALGLLVRLGHEAHVSTTGTQALEALTRQAYDVVLMDVEMPDMDGLEVTRRICSRADRRPYIVAMTASTEPGDREACLAAGMDDYLPKPLSLDGLAAALDQAWASLATSAARSDSDGESAAVGGSAASADPGEPVLDPGVVRRLAEAMGDRGGPVVNQLIALFLAEAPKLLEVLHDRRPADGAGLDEVRRAAHSLRSNAASLGARRLAVACREVEVAAQEAKDGRLRSPARRPSSRARSLSGPDRGRSSGTECWSSRARAAVSCASRAGSVPATATRAASSSARISSRREAKRDPSWALASATSDTLSALLVRPATSRAVRSNPRASRVLPARARASASAMSTSNSWSSDKSTAASATAARNRRRWPAASRNARAAQSTAAAELAISEVVTNASLHAHTAIEIRLSSFVDLVCVASRPCDRRAGRHGLAVCGAPGRP